MYIHICTKEYEYIYAYICIYINIYINICVNIYISISHVLTGGYSGDSRMWVVRETCLSPPKWYHWWVTVTVSLVPCTVDSGVALECHREGATVSRALEFMHGSSGLGYFLSFFGSEIPTQYLWTPGTALHRCPPYLVTARLPGALVLEVGNVAGLYSKRTVSRFVSTFVVRKRGVWRNSGIYHGNCWNWGPLAILATLRYSCELITLDPSNFASSRKQHEPIWKSLKTANIQQRQQKIPANNWAIILFNFKTKLPASFQNYKGQKFWAQRCAWIVDPPWRKQSTSRAGLHPQVIQSPQDRMPNSLVGNRAPRWCPATFLRATVFVPGKLFKE